MCYLSTHKGLDQNSKIPVSGVGVDMKIHLDISHIDTSNKGSFTNLVASVAFG